MIFSQVELYGFFMILTRMSGFFILVPIIGGRMVPRQVQMGLIAIIAIILYPIVLSNIQIPSSSVGYLVTAAKELLVGLAMGVAVRILFNIAEFAGTLISNEASISRSDFFDPLMEGSSTAMSSVLFYFVLMAIFVTGMHYRLIESLINSFELVPIGLSAFEPNVDQMARRTGDVFLEGLKIASPIVAISFVVNMTFTVLGKAVPKINVFMVSFSVRIFVGLSLLLLIIGLVVRYLLRYMELINQYMIDMIF
jgi:flagellar biosynthetic protein FliR